MWCRGFGLLVLSDHTGCARPNQSKRSFCRRWRRDSEHSEPRIGRTALVHRRSRWVACSARFRSTPTHYLNVSPTSGSVKQYPYRGWLKLAASSGRYTNMRTAPTNTKVSAADRRRFLIASNAAAAGLVVMIVGKFLLFGNAQDSESIGGWVVFGIGGVISVTSMASAFWLAWRGRKLKEAVGIDHPE